MQNESKVKTREVESSKDFSREENSIPQKEEVLNYLVEQNKFEDGKVVGSDISRERQLADVVWKTEAVFAGKKYKPVNQKLS